VEIIQPAPEPKASPVAESTMEAKSDDEAKSPAKYYVSGLVGNLSYAATNVKSNYGLGFSVGTIVQDRWAFEVAYVYSNHNIEDIWQPALIYHKLDQMDLGGAAKYYFSAGRLKPYAGASLSYITRKYTDRIYQNQIPGNNYSNSETTQSVNMGVLGGVDYAISDSFMLGGGADYSFNVFDVNGFDERAYNLPPGSQVLEKISFWTVKITGKFVF
jgi:outer membrane protein W